MRPPTIALGIPIAIDYGPTMPLHEVLAAHTEDVLLRWKAHVRSTLAPEATPALELLDHMPAFLDEIVAALREDAGLPPHGSTTDDSTSAAVHGEQRLRLGFSLDVVVREYGVLRDAIVSSARDAGAEITFRELQVVSDSIISGIANAVSEYTRQRDAELLRLANEHFAFVAHELRNPLTSAALAFHMLKARDELPTPSRAVEAVERGLLRATELIEQTLRLARVASGIELRRSATTLQALCDDAELEAISEAEAKGVALHVSVENDEPLSLDVRLVHSALGNLLRNAVKYTGKGGAVHLHANVTAGRAIFEVADSCGGLPPGKVEEAFAPFARLDSQQSGFGLGLAISKQAADAHGGSIRVQNIPGDGCVFVLELPIA